MNVFITGSAGQIGTNVGLALLKRGDRVEGVDVRENAWTQEFPSRICDLTTVSPGDLSPKFEPDVVLHLAAHAKVYELVEHPERAMDNIRMTFVAAEFARQRNIPIVFGSSREVYGDIHRHVTEEAAADFVVAESPYSASKIAGEAWIYSYAQCYDLPYLVFRFSNVYGRYDCDIDRMERVIPLFIRRVMNDEPITVFGPHKVLDFTYIDDCVDGVLKGIDAVAAGRVSQQIINLACGQGNTLADLVNIIGLALGKTPNATMQDARAGEVTRYVADISKAQQLLGYSPKTPLTAGLPKAIAWQREIGVL